MRIAEYKQIDVEIKETQMPILDEEGNETGEFETVRKEIPIMGMVYRDMTDEEVAEQQKAELEQSMNVQVEEKLQMLAEQITEEYPEGTIMGRGINSVPVLPCKVGYRWEKKLVGTTVVYESVADPNAIGTEQNPIIYTDESPLINNAFYKKDGKIVVYMSGEFVDWE